MGLSALATVRPDDVNVALIVHVLGAMALVGSLLTAAIAALLGWREQTDTLRRLSYKTLLFAALPSYIVMRIGAEWTYVESGLDELPDDAEPAWIGIGYITADLGALLLLVALILGGIGLRRNRSGGGRGLLQASGVIAAVLVLAYVVAVWAMGGKPT
jgi:hypothetical protein